jgi:hypothetical protein
MPTTLGTGQPVFRLWSPSTVLQSTTPTAPTTGLTPASAMPTTLGSHQFSFVPLTAHHLTILTEIVGSILASVLTIMIGTVLTATSFLSTVPFILTQMVPITDLMLASVHQVMIGIGQFNSVF